MVLINCTYFDMDMNSIAFQLHIKKTQQISENFKFDFALYFVKITPVSQSIQNNPGDCKIHGL